MRHFETRQARALTEDWQDLAKQLLFITGIFALALIQVLLN
jgi:hypothetical protein